MKSKLKQYLKIAVIFFSGLAVGIVIMGYLSMRASNTFLEVFRAVYSQEQIDLAAQAHRDGDKYAEFVYRSNAADILPLGKFKVIDNMKSTWTFTFPFAAPILDRISAVPDLERGQRITYGVELGRLAEATENIGLKEEADKLWNESAKLMGHNDINKVRSFVTKFHKIEDDANSEKSNK